MSKGNIKAVLRISHGTLHHDPAFWSPGFHATAGVKPLVSNRDSLERVATASNGLVVLHGHDHRRDAKKVNRSCSCS